MPAGYRKLTTIRFVVVVQPSAKIIQKMEYAMKIAITSTGRTLSDDVDPRFGRAKYIIIVDSETEVFDVIDNTDNSNAFKGAGIQTAGMISQKGAEVLLTGYCGPNAFRTAQAAGIKVVNDVDGTLKDALNNFKQGLLTYSDTPNADGHW